MNIYRFYFEIIHFFVDQRIFFVKLVFQGTLHTPHILVLSDEQRPISRYPRAQHTATSNPTPYRYAHTSIHPLPYTKWDRTFFWRMTKSGSENTGMDPKQALDAAMAMMGSAGGDPSQQQAIPTGAAAPPRKSTTVEVSVWTNSNVRRCLALYFCSTSLLQFLLCCLVGWKLLASWRCLCRLLLKMHLCKYLLHPSCCARTRWDSSKATSAFPSQRSFRLSPSLPEKGFKYM